MNQIGTFRQVGRKSKHISKYHSKIARRLISSSGENEISSHEKKKKQAKSGELKGHIMACFSQVSH